MKEKFSGYYIPTETEFIELWSKGTFVFDANVLLDFYRLSDNAIESLFNIFNKLKDRIWIPYQVAFEYHQNLHNVIAEQVNNYDNSMKSLFGFKKQLEEKRKHPFLTPETQKKLDEVCLSINTEFEEKKKKIKELLQENPTKNKLAELLKGKIGEQLEEKELEEIYREGEKRFAQNIPPGFKDKQKVLINEKYGDLIIWKEILKKSITDEVPLTFVTGDLKEDWFLEVLGETICGRPELINEFKNQKNNLFYIYTTDSFMKYALQYKIVDKIEDETINDVKQHLEEQKEQIATESGVLSSNAQTWDSDSEWEIDFGESDEDEINNEN